jgi:TolB-like protein
MLRSRCAYEIFETSIKKTSQAAAGNQSPNSGEKSITVLPFVNMSNDAEQDYFCDGISEEIINALAHIAMRAI